MSLIGALPRPEFLDKLGRLASPWFAWFSSAQNILASVGATGTTAQRPTSGLYAGYQYFDTTLGYAIWYSGSGWVDATGGSV